MKMSLAVSPSPILVEGLPNSPGSALTPKRQSHFLFVNMEGQKEEEAIFLSY